MCLHLNSAAQRATFPCCGSILTAIPLFFLKTVLPTSVTCTSPGSIGTYLTLRCSKRRIRRPFTSCREGYDLLDNVTGILIYSDYAYAAVREDSNLRLHPLSPGAPEKTWEDFYTAAQSYAKTHSELSGVENYGFD